LFGCFRVGDANDPEVYIAAIVAVLANYPVEIMRAVCDPSKGLPSKLKWLPTIAEIVEECGRLQDYDLRMADRQRRVEAQLAERQALPPPKQHVPRGRIVTYAHVVAMEEQGQKVKIEGVFDKDRSVPYRG
jgi:hypothetical protein